ncbi:hypothetical protein JCM16161A_22230 [Vulcanisaeta sp. JCM 16161]
MIIAEMLKSRVPGPRVINEGLSPLQVLCLFNYLDHVIAMRHHAAVFALLAGKSVTVIVYDTKIMELIKRFRGGGVKTVFTPADSWRIPARGEEPFRPKP